MLHAMPVKNCLHFLMPVRLDDWTSYDVPGVVGVMRKRATGQYELIDVLPCGRIPSARDLAIHERAMVWADAAGGIDQIRYDVFLMPRSENDHREAVAALIERSCGLHASDVDAVTYVSAA